MLCYVKCYAPTASTACSLQSPVAQRTTPFDMT